MTGSLFPGRSALAVLSGANQFWVDGYRKGAAAIDELAKNVVYYEKRARRAENVLRQVSAAMAGFNEADNIRSQKIDGQQV